MITFEIRDDLYVAGIGEDGDEVLGRCFYIFLETQQGRRFAHSHGFRTNLGFVSGICEETGESYDVFNTRDPREVEAEAESLRARIERHYRQGGKLDPQCWNEIDPAYGSTAYQFLDVQGVFLAQERKRDRENGEHVPSDIRIDGVLDSFTDLPDIDVTNL